MSKLISSKEAFIELSEGRSFLWCSPKWSNSETWQEAFIELSEGRSPKWSSSDTWHDVLTGLSLSAEEIATATHHREDTGTSQPIIFKKSHGVFKKEVEIPVTFKPQNGEQFYTLSSDYKRGWCGYVYYNNDTCNTIILNGGAWRTAEEVNIVVKETRKLYANE